MDESETQTCANCKRDIPSVNYTIHTLHCARNIRTCNVCKEPVPTAELQEHHNNFHKIVPCKQCGEGVCGTDLEDHIRDSCGLTLRECRHCSLELPRTDIPPHEQYCGARTERCPDCQEIVMIKYQQLHLESNHSFLKLSDEPGPSPSWMASNHNSPKLVLRPHSVPQPASNKNTSNAPNSQTSYVDNVHLERMFANLDLGPSENTGSTHSGAIKKTPCSRNPGSLGFPGRSRNAGPSGDSEPSGSRSEAVKKRTNDMPQVNSLQDNEESKIVKEFAKYRQNSGDNPNRFSKGAGVKKRQAPKPPNPRPAPPPNPARDLVLQNAIVRQQEERDRAEQIARNRALGLPPALTTAEKLKHLRNLSALQNGEFSSENQERRIRNPPDLVPEQRVCVKKNQNSARSPKKQYNPISAREFEERLANRDRNWESHDQNSSAQMSETTNELFPETDRESKLVNVKKRPLSAKSENTKFKNTTANIKVNNTENVSENNAKIHNAKKSNASSSGMPVKNHNHKKAIASSSGMAKNVNVKDNNVRAAHGNGVSFPSGEASTAFPDRFSSIKNELRELRRGLNEVTAPYSSPGSNTAQASSTNVEPTRASETSPPPNHPDHSISTEPSPNLEGAALRTINQWDYITDDQYSYLHNVELPCEFCHHMISANELVLHESGCRMADNLTNLVTPESDENSEPRDLIVSPEYHTRQIPTHQAMVEPHIRHGESHRQPEARCEDQLPCEFCHELFGMSRLMSHQDICQFH